MIGSRHDPQRVGQIERHVEVRILERAPPLRLEDIEQHVGGLGVHPVDPLEDEDHVVDARRAQALDDAPGAAAFDPVDQAFGVLTAQRHLHVGAVERRGRGHRQRRLPRPRRPCQARNRRPGRTTNTRGAPVAATPRPSRIDESHRGAVFVPQQFH